MQVGRPIILAVWQSDQRGSTWPSSGSDKGQTARAGLDRTVQLRGSTSRVAGCPDPGADGWPQYPMTIRIRRR